MDIAIHFNPVTLGQPYNSQMNGVTGILKAIGVMKTTDGWAGPSDFYTGKLLHFGCCDEHPQDGNCHTEGKAASTGTGIPERVALDERTAAWLHAPVGKSLPENRKGLFVIMITNVAPNAARLIGESLTPFENYQFTCEISSENLSHRRSYFQGLILRLCLKTKQEASVLVEPCDTPELDLDVENILLAQGVPNLRIPVTRDHPVHFDVITHADWS